MSLRPLLSLLTRIIVLVSIISTTYLYLYPFWSGCAFPSNSGSSSDALKDTLGRHIGLAEVDNTQLAPFRLLVLADPQLEGDSSLPDPEDALLAKLRSHGGRLRQSDLTALGHTIFDVTTEFLVDDIPRALWATRKTLDLFGNDYYLAHIYRTLNWWFRPTHVTVLGDLIGSQWVSDEEFKWRGWRYWNRVFAGSGNVEDEYMSMHEQEVDSQSLLPLDPTVSDWRRQVINIAGNHDIGYAGDISSSRIERFERTFGRVNWDIKFTYPQHLIPANRTSTDIPGLHLIVLNSMLLDTPALNSTLQQETYSYINNLITSRLFPVDETGNNSFTLLLTHVPLHKSEGVCIDAPFFDFWDFTDADGEFESGGLKEQNHLSQHVSEQGILQAIFGKSGNLDATMGGVGRKGLILNGHDHEGCDVVHYVERYNATPVVEVTTEVDDTTSSQSTNEGPWKDEDFLLTNQTEVLSPEPESTGDNNDEQHQAQNSTSTSSSNNASETPPTDPSDLSPELSSATTSSSSITASTEPTPTPTWRWGSVRTRQYPPPPPRLPSSSAAAIPDPTISLREITLRSMMGSYSGNAGLLSLWFNFTSGAWEYSFTTCAAGVQHIWWAVHVIDIVAVLSLLAWGVEWVISRRMRRIVVKRIRTISYVRERPKRTDGVSGTERRIGPVKQVKRVEDTKRQQQQRGGVADGGEGEKRRVYRHVVS
ncbi:hypothetical protein H2198_010517 [Neophaeococcomyces mojaviensis]|uniref:Uncharacterized protein n=1 Tax=Neophaeococcomyces mojaviensis TaxID=3383035 RepID=A0ACC2ZRM1_9EURO|nr:hypothetical protein H2198_010517 [Knufia sp. JES_112]